MNVQALLKRSMLIPPTKYFPRDSHVSETDRDRVECQACCSVVRSFGANLLSIHALSSRLHRRVVEV
jgi:hypothetical protein